MNVRGNPCRKEVHSGYLSPSGGGGGICAVGGDGDCPTRDVSLSRVRRAFVQGQSQHEVSEPEWGKKGYVDGSDSSNGILLTFRDIDQK